jgi:hypothetical protein
MAKKASSVKAKAKAMPRTRKTVAAGKPAVKKVYTCSTCGRVSDKMSHLCSPEKAKQTFVCAFCGRSAGDPYHVCAPMAAQMKFVCRTCGRVTPFRGGVCEPSAIR